MARQRHPSGLSTRVRVSCQSVAPARAFSRWITFGAVACGSAARPPRTPSDSEAVSANMTAAPMSSSRRVIESGCTRFITYLPSATVERILKASDGVRWRELIAAGTGLWGGLTVDSLSITCQLTVKATTRKVCAILLAAGKRPKSTGFGKMDGHGRPLFPLPLESRASPA